MPERTTSSTDVLTGAPGGFTRAAPIAAVLVLVGAVLACGSESQSSARDRAATAVCSKLESCGQLDAGQLYTSRDDCQVKQTDYWQTTWPPADCDGKNQLHQPRPLPHRHRPGAVWQRPRLPGHRSQQVHPGHRLRRHVNGPR